MGSFAPLNNAGQQGGSAMSGTGQQQTPMQGGGIGGMGLGGMPAPMQNPFLGGQPPQFSSVNTTTTQDIMGRGSSGVPFPQGPGAGISPEMLSRLLQGTPSGANGPYPALASTLPVGDMGQPYITDKGYFGPGTMSNPTGPQGGGMGQPYITDKGYFGPGTMSNPTGPQFGQEGVVTQVSRPPVDVPQYSGGTTSQPQTMEDMLARARGLIGNQYGGMGQPMPLQVSRPPVDVPYGGDMGRLIPPQVSRPPVNDSRLGQPITSVGRQPPQPRMMPEALQNLRKRIGSGSGGISNLLNRIRG